MSRILILSDGGVTGLLAASVAGQQLATGAGGGEAWIWSFATPERDAAIRRQADQFGLKVVPKQDPFEQVGGDSFETSTRMLVEAALWLRRVGGGELLWPVSAPDLSPCVPDLGVAESSVNRALLVSQLVSLPHGAGEPGVAGVRVRVPYADLTDRQVADLVLDMDLPIGLCWWMLEQATQVARDVAAAERARWTAILKEAGWVGSLEAKPAIATRSVAVRKPGVAQRGEAK